MEAFYATFAQTLRRQRRKAGLTQEALAGRLGLSRTTVVNIEKGRQRIALHQLIQVADALGCAPADLIPAVVDPSDLRDEPASDAAEFLARVQASTARRR